MTIRFHGAHCRCDAAQRVCVCAVRGASNRSMQATRICSVLDAHPVFGVTTCGIYFSSNYALIGCYSPNLFHIEPEMK